MLCRTGLPSAAGPRPGEVTAETGLPLIRAAELSRLVSERAAWLDQEAARQDGLGPVIASALSDQHSPLAIHVRGTHLRRPPGEGLQCLFLWGMWRIVWPLVGTAGRGWSFSTFEPPQGGDVDPATLPDILFRQTQDTPPAAPARPRKEIKCRPFDPSAPHDQGDLGQLAGWLVAEYGKRGGDELGKVIADWCGTEHSFLLRIQKVYTELCARYSPVVISGPASPFVSVSAVRASKHAPDPLAPAESRGSVPFTAGEPAPAGVEQTLPEQAEPAESLPLDAEATVSPHMPSPARDQGGSVSGASTLTEDREIPEQQTVAPQADTEEVPGSDQDWDKSGHQDRSREQDLSGGQEWFEDEAHGQASYAAPSADGGFGGTADRESDPWGSEPEEVLANPKQGVDPDYPASPQPSGDLPSAPAPFQSLQPDASSRPVARDRSYYAHPEGTLVSPGDNALGQVRREGKPPQLALRNQRPQSPADQYQQARDPRRPATSDLLKQLPAAADVRQFVFILEDILSPDSQPDNADRVKARREVSKDEWYRNIRTKFGKILWVDGLARIFQIIVLPDLEDPTVAKKIADWAEHAQPVIIASLLTASRISGDDTWLRMMQILQPNLAYRWTIWQHMEVLWDPSLASQSAADPGRGRFSFRRRS